MVKFENLVAGINSQTKVEEYLLNFFNKKNFKDYYISPNANNKQIKGIKILFESNKSLLERVEDSLEINPFCVEAIFIYLMLSEDVYVQYRFDAYYEEASLYGGFDEYQKENYIKILDLYVDFLLDICNVTKAIIIQKLIVKFTNTYTKSSISKLAYSYYSIEDEKEFYNLYLNAEFDAYEYILLLVTLLKHDEKLKAQEVLLDMFKNIEYGTYLDHVWDLDEADEKQKEFSKTVEECFDDINSVPTFFSWVYKAREKYEK